MLFACGVAPPEVGFGSFLRRFAASGVVAFGGERVPKLRKPTMWRRRGPQGLSNAEIRRTLAAAVAELQPIDYRDPIFAAKIK